MVNTYNAYNSYKILDAFSLKMLAAFIMIIDHIGHVLFPNVLVLRIIGRLSFPIFCFMVVEGFFHTSNIKKYISRLFIFGIISEIPYDYGVNGKLWDMSSQNVFITLLLGLVGIYLFEQYKDIIYRIVFGILVLLVAYLIKPDYHIFGVIMVFAFYFFRSNNLLQTAAVYIINSITPWYAQYVAVLAMIPICMYNGKKGKSLKYFFYVFYPVHLVVLRLIKVYLM